MPASKRRTQAERRGATIARLLDSCIASLAESGYAGTTTLAICRRAELSQGALFRHFASRTELIAAATEELCRRHAALLASSIAALQSRARAEPIEALVATIRDATRTPEHAAWHEVMVAARTDQALRTLVAPTLAEFERLLLEDLEGVSRTRASPRIGTIMLSLMHLFDSEAVTAAVYGNESLEADRLAWLVELLRRELAA